jgi:hypothetical protein
MDFFRSGKPASSRTGCDHHFPVQHVVCHAHDERSRPGDRAPCRVRWSCKLARFSPSLGTGEVFAFGEGVALPARVKLNKLPAQLLPKSEAMSGASSAAAVMNEDFLADVLNRWRSATTAQPLEANEAEPEPRMVEMGVAAAPLQPAAEAEQASSPLRRGRAGEGLDIVRAFDPDPARLSHG